MNLTVQNRIAYAYTGGRPFDPAQPVAVFIHGGALDHSVWGLQSRYLAHHGYAVLAVDLPGHGRSDGPPCASIADMADWLVELLTAAGVQRPQDTALIGHSMGSLIALDVAGRHPDRVGRIALLGTAFPMRVSDDLLDAAANDLARAHNLINIWSHASLAHYPGNPGPGFSVSGQNLRLMQRQKPGVLHADFAACNAYAAGLERAATVQCPALLLLGQRDAMTPPRAAQSLAAALKDAQVVTLAGSGHNLMGEAPDAVLDALSALLAERRVAA